MSTEIETKTLILFLRDKISKMTDEERVNLIDDLMAGYCKDCGCNNPMCQCWNDE